MRRLAYVVAVSLALLLATGCASAQEHKAPPEKSQASAPNSPEKQNVGKPGEKSESPSAERAESSREAAGEQEEEVENAEFKLSPTVRWIASHTGLSPKAAYWVMYTLDFAVIAAVIVWFSRSSLPQMFRARTAAIRATMEEARKANEEAARRLGEIESRLSRLDGEIAAMRSSSDSEAATEEERIRTAAEEDARKMVQAAEQEILAAARLAQRDLKAYAAEIAVALASKRIQVDAPTDRALVESFTGQLGEQDGSAGKGNS